MSLSSMSSSRMAFGKTTALGLPLVGMVSILAWSSPAWSLHVTLTADDLSTRISDPRLVLIADSGGTGGRDAGQGPPTGPGAGRGATGGTGKGSPGGTGPGSGMGSTSATEGTGNPGGSANLGGAGSSRGGGGSSMGGGSSSGGTSGGSGSGGGGR